MAVDLEFRGSNFSGSYGFEIAAVRGGDYRISREDCVVRRAEFGSDDEYFRVRDGMLVSTSSSVALPPASDDRLFLVLASGLKEFRPVFDGLRSINIYNLNPDAMRQLQKPDAGELLRRDGSNIASVVEQLRRTAPSEKERIEEYLRQIVPGVTSVNRRGLGAWETVEFKQHIAGAKDPWVFPATSMSDGTLRALGVLVALFAPAGRIYTPIGIEEPETALHPAASGLLLEALQSASRQRQVFVTSHSPDLLDSPRLTPEHILAVRAEGGTSHIGRLDEASSRALKESLFTAGELLRLDQLQPGHFEEPLELFS